MKIDNNDTGIVNETYFTTNVDIRWAIHFSGVKEEYAYVMCGGRGVNMAVV